MLAGFAADAEAAGEVGAGGQAALDGFADVDVFLLDALSDIEALPVVLLGGG